MMKKTLFLAFACLPAIAFAQSRGANPQNDKSKSELAPGQVENLNELNEPPMLGIHWAKGFEPSFRAREARNHGGGGSALMTYHGGKIMPDVNATAIFWGTSWGTYSGDKITGMDTWYTGFNASNYAAASDEYTGTNGRVTQGLSYGGNVVDTSASTGGNSTATILAEVCKVIKSPDPSGNGYYAVYTDTPRGNAQYCAWHSSGSCSGVPVQFGFFFKLDGDAG